MKCPRCQTENYEGANFCTACGCMIPKESRAKKFFMTLLRALLYVALFMGIQTAVTFVYSFVLSFSTVSGMLSSGMQEYDAELFTQELMNAVYHDLHTLMLISGLITILVLVISFRIRHKDVAEEMHVSKIPLIRAPWCVVLGIALQPVINFLLNFLPESLLTDFAETNTLSFATGPIAIELLNVVILTPILEELIFRGLAFTRLRRGMGITAAILISAVIFGAVHGHPVSFLYASVLGVVQAWIMIKNNDSVIGPILCHAGFNGGSYLLNLVLGESTSTPLYLAVSIASLAMVILSSFMVFRPIPDKE